MKVRVYFCKESDIEIIINGNKIGRQALDTIYDLVWRKSLFVGSEFVEKSGPPAWKQLPTWYQIYPNPITLSLLLSYFRIRTFCYIMYGGDVTMTLLRIFFLYLQYVHEFDEIFLIRFDLILSLDQHPLFISITVFPLCFLLQSQYPHFSARFPFNASCDSNIVSLILSLLVAVL